jgi:hypothetical protein
MYGAMDCAWLQSRRVQHEIHAWPKAHGADPYRLDTSSPPPPHVFNSYRRHSLKIRSTLPPLSVISNLLLTVVSFRPQLQLAIRYQIKTVQPRLVQPRQDLTREEFSQGKRSPD